MWTDFHTHNLESVPGTAIVNLPKEALEHPENFRVENDGYYSVGIHPWWTSENMERLWKGFEYWLTCPRIVAVGECGLDKLQGASLGVQEEIFLRQAEVAERLRLPVTVHCVKAYDRLLALHKQVAPAERWTVHGFRGKPALARQLLAAGFNLSYGLRYNEESWEITPPERRYRETDDDRFLL